MKLRVHVRVGRYERLAWYVRGEGEISPWEAMWGRFTGEEARDFARYYQSDPVLMPAFLQYLPKGRPILEAGCGAGQWVYLLRQMGYAVEGVDNSPSAIALARRAFGELPVRLSDVTALDYPDGFLGGYVSLGVMEHFHEGPAAALQEVRRVLDSDGVLLCTVPYFNPLRKLRRYGVPPVPHDLHFYQWAFSRDEFYSILWDSGFKVIRAMPCSPLKTLRDEFSAVRVSVERAQKIMPRAAAVEWRKGLRSIGARWTRGLVRAGEQLTFLRVLAGHMMLYVAVRR